jgi:hypothetical protein
MASFGGNEFSNCAIPLIFYGRAFIIEETLTGPMVSVLRPVGSDPVFEVLRNEPAANPFTKGVKNVTGIITVTDAVDGRFLYKVRPGAETSLVFGAIPAETSGGEVEVTIKDRDIIVWREGQDGERVRVMTATGNKFHGTEVGIIVNDRGIAVGATLPPELQRILRPS